MARASDRKHPLASPREIGDDCGQVFVAQREADENAS
jgi:hypothetical protein